VAYCKDNRGRWMWCNKRRHNNQPGQTREVDWRRTPRLAVGRQEVEEEGYFYQAVECVFDQICSFGHYVIRYVMFLCFWVQFRTKLTKCFFAYVMLNIICLKVTGLLIFLPSRHNPPTPFSHFYQGQSKQSLPLLNRLSQIHLLAKFLR
jgi:hypothetical protein